MLLEKGGVAKVHVSWAFRIPLELNNSVFDNVGFISVVSAHCCTNVESLALA